ncbi:MAG: ATP-dependent DNA helicase RecG [Chloroflexi bacterium]|nr:ATP-dependent DNA helicase RecG [Chloroflexota bacterium]
MDIDRLRKVLEHEARLGFDDRAVIGGLEAFIRNWLKDTGQLARNPSLALDRFLPVNSSYAAMDKKGRQEWVGWVMDLLEELEAPAALAAAAASAAPRAGSPTTAAGSSAAPVAIAPEIPLNPPLKKGERPLQRGRVTGAPTEKSPLDYPITVLKGIHDKVEAKFAKLGVKTVRDALYFFPRRHLDYSQLAPISSLKPGQEQTVIATVWEARVVKLGNMRCTEATVGDDSGNIRAIWFNQPFLAEKFHVNDKIVFSGRVTDFRGQLQLDNPAWEHVEDKELIHTGRLVPVYPLTAGLFPRQVRRLVKEVVDRWSALVEDFIPYDIKNRCRLLNLDEAIAQAHFPDSLQLKDRARERLAFDELFLLQLGVLSRKQKWQESQPGTAIAVDREALDRFLNSLPFKLTQAQARSLQEILEDLARPVAMSRLLQGEVGSGKTVVAMAALLAVVAGGHQGAVMAPTEILAEQHFRTFTHLLSDAGHAAGNPPLSPFAEGGENLATFARPPLAKLTVALLTSNTKGKKALYGQISEGAVDLVVGTHAVIQEGVEFHRLGLAVIDEQHRFGVAQRSALRQKGFNPHMLVMTATPIPRSLALTLYGDLDLSVIDQLPPGRQTIATKWVSPEKRQAAYQFLRQEIGKGRQAFIICPLIEESEAVETRAAVEEYNRLSREVFPDLRLGLLHGRLPPAKKDETMRLFRDHAMDILVSTPVVEVGIDIPNATVMLVEGADHFGLSQLHQFRGRVGRGTEKSYCLLLAEDPSPEGQERLALIEKTHDGFKLAEEDLRLRGPGEFFGTRQSGVPDLRMARISDVALLEKARREAQSLFMKDPRLELPHYLPLRREMARVWKEGGEWS